MSMNDEQFAQLIEAIKANTDAITQLAQSNAALIQAMAEAEGLDEGEEPSVYLDGTPCR